MAIASLLDPRFKLKLLEIFFPHIYGEDRAMEEVANVRKLCEDIFQDYKSQFVPQISHANTSGVFRSNHVNFGGETESLDDFFSWNTEASSGSDKSEFDSYLEEKTLPKGETHDFDVLGWWKTNEIKYPIMSEIARDILPIPILTVASEFSFSNIIEGVDDIYLDEEESDITELIKLAAYRSPTPPQSVDEVKQSWLLRPEREKDQRRRKKFIQGKMIKSLVLYAVLAGLIITLIIVLVVVARRRHHHCPPPTSDNYTVALHQALTFFNAQRCSWKTPGK
ncbi:hypothetical protein EZV62_010333 [Acer yangbiense]|uniref:HAT C-terminal dimerisation domain-containing protein n=1 Tax=Acer yangbiense TaxID=1000413 RepID=A0A5C7I330_9ROSI|nr:hypothetical protein EZV62_010333 [Acer yangbiense]